MASNASNPSSTASYDSKQSRQIVSTQFFIYRTTPRRTQKTNVAVEHTLQSRKTGRLSVEKKQNPSFTQEWSEEAACYHFGSNVGNRIKRCTWSGKKWTSRKAMSPKKTSCARPPQSQRLKECRRPKRTNVPLHANRIVAVVLCQNHSGKQLVHLTHHHGSTQVPKKALYRGDLWELSHPRKLALAILSTQGKLALFPKG